MEGLLRRAQPFVIEVLELVGELGMEGRIEIVGGGVWDQPARWHEGVLILRAAYHGAEAKKREAEERKGKGKGGR